MIWSIALVTLFAVAMAHIIVISKKMDNIIDLIKNKSNNNDEKKEG